MNAGKDVHTLMREITLPPELDVGEGYGKVSWDVRAIWENYSGWFHHRSTTELYGVGPDELNADLVDLAGADRVVARAEHKSRRAIRSTRSTSRKPSSMPTRPTPAHTRCSGPPMRTCWPPAPTSGNPPG